MDRQDQGETMKILDSKLSCTTSFESLLLHSLGTNLPSRTTSSSSNRLKSSIISFFNATLIYSLTLILLVASNRVNCQDMSLPLELSLPRACTPLNITFPVSEDAFPYTVWIVGNLSAASTWRINSDYPRSGDSNNSVTFQYSVPLPNGPVTSFSVAVGDSKGRGNTTGILSMTTDHGAPTSCNPWTENNNFYWGVRALSGSDPDNFEECEELEFFSDDQRGYAPFTLTFIPLGGSLPKSIQLTPNVTKGLVQNNQTDFSFRTLLPFPAGTLLQITVGDSVYFGGGGGASKVYSVAPNRNSSNVNCESQMERDGIFATQTPLIIPGAPIASFNSLTGAISEYPTEKKNNAPIIGGVIGATVAVGLVIAGLILFILYRKRKQRKREELMWKEPKFVEVDERDGGRGWRRGVNQTYSVSPFVPTSGSSGSGSSAPSAQGGVIPQTHASADSAGAAWRSESGSGNYSGILYQLPPSDSPPISPSSGAGGYSSVPTSSSYNWPSTSRLNQTSSDINRSSSQVQHQRGSGSAADSYITSGGGARSIPVRTSLLDSEIEESTGGTLMTQTDSQGGTRRVLVHSDGGFLQGDSLDDGDDQEDVDELPPSYDRDWGTSSSTSNSISTSNPNANSIQTSTSLPNSHASASSNVTPISIPTNLSATHNTMNPSPLRQEAFLSESQSATTTSEENEREREIRERIERERREQDADNAEMWLNAGNREAQ